MPSYNACTLQYTKRSQLHGANDSATVHLRNPILWTHYEREDLLEKLTKAELGSVLIPLTPTAHLGV